MGTADAIRIVALPGGLGASNDLVVAGSTLAAAAVSNPVRRRIQRAVDHRFNRARYDAEREVDALSSRLEDAVDLTTVTDDLSHVLDRTLFPAHRAVWIRTVPAGQESRCGQQNLHPTTSSLTSPERWFPKLEDVTSPPLLACARFEAAVA